MIRTDTRPLRFALAANAAFSLTCAVVLLLRPSLVGDWLGIQAPLIFQVVGAGLAVFAADLLHQATRRRMATWRALYASMADFSWVAGTGVLLALFPGCFRRRGLPWRSASRWRFLFSARGSSGVSVGPTGCRTARDTGTAFWLG
jgi:hypothetical protein